MKRTAIVAAILATSFGVGLATPAFAKHPPRHDRAVSLNAYARMQTHHAGVGRAPAAPKVLNDPDLMWELNNEAAHGMW